jgi:hypothetical protein
MLSIGRSCERNESQLTQLGEHTDAPLNSTHLAKGCFFLNSPAWLAYIMSVSSWAAMPTPPPPKPAPPAELGRRRCFLPTHGGGGGVCLSGRNIAPSLPQPHEEEERGANSVTPVLDPLTDVLCVSRAPALRASSAPPDSTPLLGTQEPTHAACVLRVPNAAFFGDLGRRGCVPALHVVRHVGDRRDHDVAHELHARLVHATVRLATVLHLQLRANTPHHSSVSKRSCLTRVGG